MHGETTFFLTRGKRLSKCQHRNVESCRRITLCNVDVLRLISSTRPGEVPKRNTPIPREYYEERTKERPNVYSQEDIEINVVEESTSPH